MHPISTLSLITLVLCLQPDPMLPAMVEAHCNVVEGHLLVGHVLHATLL